MTMAPTTLEWIRHAYEVAELLDTDEKVDDLVSAIVESTGEPECDVRTEVLGIIRDIRSARRVVAAGR